jgi:hypothetical protein
VSHLARHHPWFCDLADRSCRAAATVAVDFDGVLHQKSGRFSDEVTGDPVPGAADGLRRLAERYHVVIFTARTALDPVRRWLAEQGMDGFEVTHEKPPAEFYIDDHGFHFTSWGEVESKLLEASAEPSAKW